MAVLTWASAILGSCLVLSGCSSSSLSTPDEALPENELPKSVLLVPLYESPRGWSATALAFDPKRAGQLWVTLRQFLGNKPCLETARSGCSALEGKVALVTDATAATPSMVFKIDGNAWHFMRRPTSIAFGDNGNLSTCGEARTDNFEDEAVDYSGPVLWDSDPTVFGVEPKPGQNGTHIDMLHQSPFCMGVAFEKDNAYWVFNGQIGALDRYDFRVPHVIGGEDHSDGELKRYVRGQLKRVPEVPSHLVLDQTSRQLYVADTGNGRLVRLAIDSGVAGGNVPPLDPIPVHRLMEDATLEQVVAPGTLEAPSGIALDGQRLIVTDNATSKIWWFDLDGTPLGSVTVDLPSGSLSGVTLGPDAKLYVSDLLSGMVYRLEKQ